jgi:ribosomal protein S18 acetylase RimI-like enzyme
MSRAYSIREAREGDMDALVELLGLLFAIESDFAPDAARQRQGLALMLRPGAARLALVAADAEDARVLGMATAQVVISTAEGAPSLLVEDVVLRPEARGLGIGRSLLARIEDWGRRLGATRMQLVADKDNAQALGFYDSCGFTRTNLLCLRRLLPAGK